MKQLATTTIALILIFKMVHGQGTKEARFLIKDLPNWPAKDSEILKPLMAITELKNDSLCSDLFYWTNYCRKYPKTFWNKIIDPFLNIYPQFRTSFTVSLKEDLFNIKEPLSLLEPDSRLFSATKKHSIDLKNSWPTNSHNSSFGKTFQERLREDGLFDCASENISVGSAGVILHLIFLFIDEGLTDLGH